MTSSQRVIKGLAIALATFIICLIASAILGFINFFLVIFDPIDNSSNNKESIFRNYEDIKYLDIDLGSINLEIDSGDEFKIESPNSKVTKITNIKNTIKIRQQNTLFWNNENYTVKIYIPHNTLDEIELDIGAGRVSIDNLTSKSFDLDQGAGYVSIKNSTFNKTNIDGGAGKIEIDNSTLKDLDYKAGVGNTTITNSSLLGKCDIDAGVGSVNIELKDYKEDYKIIASKGLGSLKVDGEDLDGTIGTGINELKIDGGVGSIAIDFNGLKKIK